MLGLIFLEKGAQCIGCVMLCQNVIDKIISVHHITFQISWNQNGTFVRCASLKWALVIIYPYLSIFEHFSLFLTIKSRRDLHC